MRDPNLEPASSGGSWRRPVALLGVVAAGIVASPVSATEIVPTPTQPLINTIAIPGGPDKPAGHLSTYQDNKPTHTAAKLFPGLNSLKASSGVLLKQGRDELGAVFYTTVCMVNRQKVHDIDSSAVYTHVFSTALHCLEFKNSDTVNGVAGAHAVGRQALRHRYFIGKPGDINTTPIAEVVDAAVYGDPNGDPTDNVLLRVEPPKNKLKAKYRTIRPKTSNSGLNPKNLPTQGEKVYFYGQNSANQYPVFSTGTYLGRSEVPSTNTSSPFTRYVDVVGVNASPKASGCYFGNSGVDAVTKSGYQLRTFQTRLDSKDGPYLYRAGLLFKGMPKSDLPNAFRQDAKTRLVNKANLLQNLGITDPNLYSTVCTFGTPHNNDQLLADRLYPDQENSTPNTVNSN